MYGRFTIPFVAVALCVSLIPTAGVEGADTGLVGWWQFEEGAGMVAADSSGNGHDGTLETPGEWIPGRQGMALGFGTSRCTRLDCGVFDPTGGTGTFSLSLWCRWDGTTGTQHFLTKSIAWGATTAMFQVEVKGGSTNAAQTDRFALAYQGNPQAILHAVPKNEWAHMALTFNGAHATGYLNGVDQVGPQSTGIGPNVDAPVLIGASHPAERRTFEGFLDDVRIYSRALTAAEVKEIAQLPPAPRVKAWSPSPADGAKAVTLPLFTWKSLETIRLHDVYVGTSPDLTEANRVASRQPLNMYFHAPGLQPGVTYYWRVDGIESDMVTVHTGDVWSFIAQPVTAYAPQPADGANTVWPGAALQWLAGLGAIKHHLYFSDNRDAVQRGAASADKGLLTDVTFAPADLAGATTYYWRVDEIGLGDVVRTGALWSFTTVVPVDDFESYTDDEGNRIYEIWIDGWTNSTGSTVGYTTAPFAERIVVHGGQQSMPLDYNNVNAPFYSEAELVFATRQNWTANGTDTLVLYVRGRPANKAAPVYVALMDTSNRRSAVTHPDATLATTAKWTEWKIPLSSFTGVNAAAVKAVYIGLGDKASPAKGGTGLIYVDDLCLAVPAPGKQ